MIKLTIIGLLLLGGWQFGSGSYIYAKAEVAQYLMADAWVKTREGNYGAKPWPWADTWPVARLTSKRHDIDLTILHGSDLRTLAFGPGHMVNTPLPGDRGNSVVGGHRDTHFAFLQQVRVGDVFTVETHDQRLVQYQVDEVAIVDHNEVEPVLDQSGNRLTLVTCYPFEALVSGGPLRYVVVAKAV
jgi:sortase A